MIIRFQKRFLYADNRKKNHVQIVIMHIMITRVTYSVILFFTSYIRQDPSVQETMFKFEEKL
jgi:hypothetical protein